MEYTEEQILEKYNSLPQELKTAMASVESAQIIQQIEKKYGLNIEQAGELASETGFVLMGLTRPENFIRNLSERLELDAQKAKEIALDVNSQIFSRVKESLKRIHGIGQEKTEASTPQKQNAVGIPPMSEKPAQKTELLELTKKHEAEKHSEPPGPTESVASNPAKEAPRPNYFEALKQKISAEEIVNPVRNNVSNGMKEPSQNSPQTTPQDTNLPEKTKDEISRYTKQTTEIKLPEKENTDTKQMPLKTNEYPKGDPYKEPI